MTWLSEIETDIEEYLEEWRYYVRIIKVLVRVLRELAQIAKAAKEASEDWVPLRKYFDNLSPEANELLD